MEQRDVNSQTRADTYGMRPDLFAALSGNMVKKTDLDALLPMSGTVIIDSSLGSSVGSNRWLPLTEQVGEMRGCNLSPDPTSGGIVLNEIGQWDVSFRCQVAATGIVAPENEIRLETWFDGNMVDRQYSIVTLGMAGNWNLSVDATVIVDGVSCFE